jgi:sugar/nucleoside kinase (ribokinase family)
MILVTPDGHRTMNTFLGAAQELAVDVLDEDQIRAAAILYLEGYLWDPETPRYAMVRAIEVAREAGRKVAFSLSDLFCVDRHRDGFQALVDGGRIDILFANEAEILALAGMPHLNTAVEAVAPKVETLVVTRGAAGALAVRSGERADIPAEPVSEVVDTTGAGDLFAAGFLFGHATGQSVEISLKLGAICAAEIIQHYGARPQEDLKALAGTLLD